MNKKKVTVTNHKLSFILSRLSRGKYSLRSEEFGEVQPECSVVALGPAFNEDLNYFHLGDDYEFLSVLFHITVVELNNDV